MICPKCKTKVSGEDTVCPTCKLRLVFKCPRCGSPTRLGSVSCKKCGFTFVKFCPECHSANYASSSSCRKCGYEFENEDTTPIIEAIESAPIINQASKKAEPVVENNTPVLIYIEFTNLEKTFEKYNKDEFKEKVIDNIKTTIKIAFGANPEFVSDYIVRFNYSYSKSVKILDKINQFEEEFDKFNKIIERTLNTALTYKFAITSQEEVENIKDPEIIQLKYASDKDVIISSGTYTTLNSELSLIKISPDSYKMVFLDKKPVFEQSEDVKYDKALDILVNNVSDINSKTRVVSVNAPRGAGKTHLLNNLCYKIERSDLKNTVLFNSRCSALTQVSPWGLIQNFFINFFDCPKMLDKEFTMKDFEARILERLNLEKMDEESFSTLANLIYPQRKDYFENILINKEITYKYLKEIFLLIKHKKSIIFVIDDFDLIDESSFSFLKYLVDADYFEHDAKMILGYKSKSSAAMYFRTNKLTNDNCLNISLRTISLSEGKNLARRLLGQNSEIPDEIVSQISYNSQGNIAYVEQILHYLFEKKLLYIDGKTVKFKNLEDVSELPKTMEECFLERLTTLKEQNIDEYKFLMTISLLGDKPDYKVIQEAFEFDREEFFDIVKRLSKKGYLKRKVDDIYEFRNSLTWSYCYIKAKEDEIIKKEAKKLLDVLKNKVITTPLICPILAQITEENLLAFALWTKNLQYANYIGDTNIYCMAQKQSLILLESIKLDNFEYTKNNIMERLGKLIYDKDPMQAIDYLTNVIIAAKKNDDVNKVIDVSGYLVKSSYLIQDFNAVIEVVDNVLKYFDTADKDKKEKKSTLELQATLVKTRKLTALLKLGCWEEIASIVNAEINPVLQKHLNIFSKNNIISQNEIFKAWIESNITLAQSYAIQGSPLAFELIAEIDKVLGKEKSQKTDYLKVYLAYADAMANTSKGYFAESDLILQDIIKDYSYIIDSPSLVCEWNIISLINKILRLDFKYIKDELFEATAYADNCRDEISKNLLKTLLAYVYLEEKSYLKAIEIATNQMQYFSSKKIAFGALLAWYISAAATAGSKADMYCIEICEKAVKICENAQNNNFFFKILFQETLAKAYLKLNDKENARMYCDLGLQGANANELLYLQVRLNNLKAQIARENLSKEPDKKKFDYAQNVIRMYSRTIELAKRLELDNYVKKIEKEQTSFRAHCQLNRIIEDK